MRAVAVDPIIIIMAILAPNMRTPHSTSQLSPHEWYQMPMSAIFDEYDFIQSNWGTSIHIQTSQGQIHLSSNRNAPLQALSCCCWQRTFSLCPRHTSTFLHQKQNFVSVLLLLHPQLHLSVTYLASRISCTIQDPRHLSSIPCLPQRR